jgi:hypothetical protein
MERTIFAACFWYIIGFDKHALKPISYGISVIKEIKEVVNIMGTAIEYQKLMTEIVYINLPGPEEPAPVMTGGELLHGFLAELHRTTNQELREYINALCNKWNIRYRDNKGK